MWFYAVFFIVGCLLFPASACFFNGLRHGIGDGIGIENDFAISIAGRPAKGLYEGSCGSQKALLVCIQDADKGNFWDIQSFAQKVDSYEHVELSGAQGS